MKPPLNKIIAVDFDGTCVDHRFPDVGADAPYAVEVLKELVERKCDLILWTMRSGKYLDDAIEWFKQRGIPLFSVNCNPTQGSWTISPKAYAHCYVDDAAVGAPLLYPAAFARPCVDWLAVREIITGENCPHAGHIVGPQS